MLSLEDSLGSMYELVKGGIASSGGCSKGAWS